MNSINKNCMDLVDSSLGKCQIIQNGFKRLNQELMGENLSTKLG